MVRNISSNWCIIPLEPRDAGRLFTVRLTPMVAETVHKDVEFLIGSDYNIVLEQLREDTVQLILGVICIALGMIIFLIQLYLQIFSGSSQTDILYMGVVSVLLGVWRMSDICAAPLIFTKNAGILGYISDSILLVGGSALILFAATRVREKHAPKVHILGVIACSIALLLLGLQVFGVIEIAEFKFVSYGMLILGSIMLILASIFSKKDDSANKSQFTWKLLPIVTVGIVLDFVTFYQNKSSSTLIYTTLFFLIFMAITFIASFRETSKMAYQDSRTGLFNKARWNELMHGGDDINEPIGILVLDLNGLKQVNDTLGHEAGDVMISAFAEILKNVLPSSSVICRWGGDEFAVWFPKISRQKLDSYTEALLRAAEDYNATEPAARISFAMGAILAEEHPGMSRSDLFRLADDQMYSNKRKWYAGKVMSKGKK
jgi:diguanylate cyclase (GGDEF)-like protein